MYESLTPKQENFVQGLFTGLSQREAYKQAGYKVDNMPDKSIDELACILAKNPKVSSRLQGLQDTVANKNINITVDWIAQQYAKIAGVDINDFLTFGRREVPVMGAFGPVFDENKKPIMKTVNFVDFIDSSLIDGTLVSEVKVGKDGASIKVHDRMKALDALAKYLGMFVDKHEFTGNMTFEIVPAPKPQENE